MLASLSRTEHVSRRFVLTAAQIVLLGCGGALLAGALPQAQGPPPGTDPAKLQRFEHEVLPVLQENCLRCHGGMNRRGGYSMATRASAIAGGHHGAAIVPGQPDASLLVKLIGPGPYPEDLKPMPLKGKLTDAEVRTLRQWVADGAVMEQ